MVILGERPYPFNAALEITRACNLRCRHCGTAADGSNREAPLSLEEWKNVIDDLRRLCTRHLTFSGGEPFLYKHWRELVDYACASRDMVVSIISNGTRVSEEDVVFLRESGLSHLAVSVDGDAATHDAIRGMPGAFERTMETVALCRRHGVPVGVVSSISRLNFDIRHLIRELIIAAGIDMWQVQIVNGFGRAGGHEKSIMLSQDQYDRLVDDTHAWRDAAPPGLAVYPADSIGYCDQRTDALFGDAEWHGCPAGIYNIGIEANGAIKGCLSLQDDSFIVANVRDRSLPEVWFDPQAFAYSRHYDFSAMTGRCGACASRQRCRGGCLATAYSVTGATKEAPYCYSGLRTAPAS